MEESVYVCVSVCAHLGVHSDIFEGCLEWVTVHLFKCVWEWEFALGVHKFEKQRVNGPLCTAMNGAPDEGDTHQLALMTSHFLHRQALSPHKNTTHRYIHVHTLTHTLAGTCIKSRRKGAGGQGVGWTRVKVKEKAKRREMKQNIIETMNVVGEVIHFISCLWIDNLGFSVFLIFACTKQVIKRYTCIPGTYYGSLLFLYVPLFSHFSVLAGLIHFTCFQLLKITARDVVCTWRILVTVPLCYISHYHNLLLTWFIIRTLVNC